MYQIFHWILRILSLCYLIECQSRCTGEGSISTLKLRRDKLSHSPGGAHEDDVLVLPRPGTPPQQEAVCCGVLVGDVAEVDVVMGAGGLGDTYGRSCRSSEAILAWESTH